jgi:hypothetical protein
VSLNLTYLMYSLSTSTDSTKYLPVSHEVLQKRFEPTEILQGGISMKRFEVTCIWHMNDRCDPISLTTFPMSWKFKQTHWEGYCTSLLS